MKKLKLIKIINQLAAAIFVAGLLLAPTGANATCRIFQHRDYGGSGYTLHNMERLVMVSGENVGCSAPGCETVLYDASWNDQVSSFQVTGGCTLTLWQHINKGGAYFRSSRSYL